MRAMICAVAAVCFSVFAAAAHADPMYTFSLTSTTGTAGTGSGGFTISSTPSTGINSVSTYDSPQTVGDGDLEALSFTINRQTFTLADSSNNGLVQFTSGSLSDITYSGSEKSGIFTLSFNADGLEYSYYDQQTGVAGTGNITNVSLAPAATPEPSSLMLLGTGLVGAYGMLRRRRKLA